MGTTKTNQYTKKQNELAVMLKAIAHPARIAIIELLLKKNSCICNDIVDEIQLAQPTVSQHLKELKQAGWISGEIEGTAICYCVNPKIPQRLLHYFDTMYQKSLLNTDKCCQ